MGPIDFVIVAAVLALVALAIRSLAKGGHNGCSSCSSGAGCRKAGMSGASCPAASDMVARASAAVSSKDRGKRS